MTTHPTFLFSPPDPQQSCGLPDDLCITPLHDITFNRCCTSFVNLGGHPGIIVECRVARVSLRFTLVNPTY